jgi:cephalosporin hydroxylase
MVEKEAKLLNLMKISIDTEERVLQVKDERGLAEFPLYSDPAFEIVSRMWLKIGWNQKYTYTFSWFGRPVIQLPEDLMRVQEVLYRVRPDVIVETGVAHGGSLIFYASICKALGFGRIIGVDIEIRPHNRSAIEHHELASLVTLIEADSVSRGALQRVASLINPGDRVLVVLDSGHSGEHVLAELESYSPFVSKGSFIIATDGLMEDLHDVPRGKRSWVDDNPAAAAQRFAARHPEFVMERPRWEFNESTLNFDVTHWPSAYLRRVADSPKARST